MFSKKFLDRMGWELWHPRVRMGVDMHSWSRFKQEGAGLFGTFETYNIRDIPGTAIDVKDGRGKTSWERLGRSGFISAATQSEVFDGVARSNFPWGVRNG